MSEPLNLEDLITEQTNPASAGLDTLTTAQMLAVINAEDRNVALAVERELPRIARAVDAIAAALAGGGRLFYAGAGTSGRLGVLDASECVPTFNVPPGLVQGLIAGGDFALRNAVEGTEDSPERGREDLIRTGFTSGDVLCGIAASGRTPYVIGAMEYANSIGAATIGLSCVAGSPVAALAKYPIEPVTGPEVVTGSTRMKAGTATKMVLNMLSTGAMVRLGYVYSNLMVNVQPKNAKLVDRAQRIIMAIAGVDRESAARALASSDKDVRVAVVMAARGVDAAQARRMLESCGGRLRDALGT